jgi:hypothetical protein
MSNIWFSKNFVFNEHVFKISILAFIEMEFGS